MIKLTLSEKPEQLTEAEEKRLTEEFKRNPEKTVWKQDYIEKSLLEMTHGKCAYSEQKLNTRSAYMEIEHFKHKDLYKDDVVKWGNLLPACKKCNAAKGKWDVVKEPIVNPLVDIPKKHLYVQGFRFYKRDEKGASTIKAVALNDRKHFVNPRGEMAIRIVDEIEETYNHLKTLVAKHHRRIQAERIKSLMEECGPENEFSAVISTYLLYEWPIFPEMEKYLRESSLWDDGFEGVKSVLADVAMPFKQ